jgi:hypothetical protein
MAKRVLVCPMDWGLGHASRCIPVIRAFRNEGWNVTIASSGGGAELIRQEPDLAGEEIVPFPGFRVSYSRTLLFARLALQMPEFLYHKVKEKRALNELVKMLKPDLIVSDNRYGLLHDSVPSVLITHQLNPSLPGRLSAAEKPLSSVIRGWAGAFNECWIPDVPENPAAGKLTEGWERLGNAFFTGWLSRFAGAAIPAGGAGSPRYRIIFILSGPEPQRTMLEGMITGGCLRTGINALLVRGLPGEPPQWESRGNLEIVSYLASAGLLKAAGESELVVCRSGYSSVMDMLALGKTALLVPTPGQTEQEYLGKWLAQKQWFRVISQKEFKVETIIEMDFPEHGRPVPAPGLGDLLQERVRGLTAG